MNIKNSKFLVAVFIASLFFLSGCEDQHRTVERSRLICQEETKKPRADFILKCIGNANPKSDEEPEDWIYKCKVMAEETFCDYENVMVRQYAPNGGY